ncbi:hypothetical protein [Paenibacillus sp. IHBB 3054]|uniref:hypothetical protein n=1 Tax=Paenibacillus sp. IHBB 3054 TaxID=3425689 RepID=UPI003F66E4A9
MHEEENDLIMNRPNPLKEANRKVDKMRPELWAAAEANLQKAEADFKREKGEK